MGKKKDKLKKLKKLEKLDKKIKEQRKCKGTNKSSNRQLEFFKDMLKLHMNDQPMHDNGGNIEATVVKVTPCCPAAGDNVIPINVDTAKATDDGSYCEKVGENRYLVDEDTAAIGFATTSVFRNRNMLIFAEPNPELEEQCVAVNYHNKAITTINVKKGTELFKGACDLLRNNFVCELPEGCEEAVGEITDAEIVEEKKDEPVKETKKEK